MTPAAALASLRLALPGWDVAWSSTRLEYSARRGDTTVHARSPGDLVDAAARLADARIREPRVAGRLVLDVDADLGGAVAYVAEEGAP